MIIDCDVHSMPRSGDVEQFLPKHWLDLRRTIGPRARQPFGNMPNHPFMSYLGTRCDSLQPDGQYPGSDLTLMREQLLDLHDVAYGMMMPLLRGQDERNPEFGAALVHATNEWQATVCDREPRLKAGMHITMEYPAAAIKEIELRAGDRRFTHVMITPRCLEPLGRSRYWPILEACAANGFPLALHQNGANGYPMTAGGFPSFYYEGHTAYPHSGAAAVTSLVIEGVFEHIPNLRVVVVEHGFAWLPSLTWRLDKHYKRLRDEVPHLRRLPSEYIRDHIWVTTQPIEEPEQPDDLLATCEWVGWDRIMFSSDYPHWDFDDPRFAFQAPLTGQQQQMVFYDNAAKFFGLVAGTGF